MAYRCVKELDQDPVTQEEDGTYLEEEGKEEYGNHCENPGSGKEEKIGSHDAGNGTARSYSWESGSGIPPEVDQRGSSTAEDIECEKTEWSQPVFNVVPENIEKPHVPEQIRNM
jgi:hypothetical protein